MSFMLRSGRFTPNKENNGLLDYERLAELCDINRLIFASISNLDVTLDLITQSAQSFLNVKRCTIWLVNPENEKELIARCVKDPTKPNESDEQYYKIPIDSGLAGWCASNRKTLNISDAYNDNRFDKSIDEATGYKTQAILSIPIFAGIDTTYLSQNAKNILEYSPSSSDINLVGVMQLLSCSKISEMAELLGVFFAEYVGVALSNCIHYQQMQNAKIRTNVLMDIMTYHYNIEDSSLEKIINHSKSNEFKSKIKNICSWTFSPRILDKFDTITLAYYIFNDLGIKDRFRIKSKVLCRFILSVHKSYRTEVPYHNWFHAISVLHFAYILLKLCPFDKYLTQLQMDIFPLAALTHDIDHRGTNNAFQSVSQSDLAALYSSAGSILERHHLAQTMCLLNSPKCAILKHLPKDVYKNAVDILQHLILITDIGNHLKALPDIKGIAKSFDKSNNSHQLHLLGLMMTCCDLNQVTKPLNIALSVCDLIYKEFHAQGDAEKEKGHTPHPMMDREISDAPKEQIGFITFLAMPAFQLLTDIIPEAQQTVDNVNNLLIYWQNKQKQ